MSYYQGIFTPKFPNKYKGDVNNIVFRSSWEKSLLRWMDLNPNVEWYSSEELIIPYVCATDGRPHRYFPDIFVKFVNGPTVVIELKPSSQCHPPKSKSGKKKETYLTECATFAKNSSKWNAADRWCEERGYVFQVWTEKTLSKLGIHTRTGGKFIRPSKKTAQGS